MILQVNSPTIFFTFFPPLSWYFNFIQVYFEVLLSCWNDHFFNYRKKKTFRLLDINVEYDDGTDVLPIITWFIEKM